MSIRATSQLVRRLDLLPANRRSADPAAGIFVLENRLTNGVAPSGEVIPSLAIAAAEVERGQAQQRGRMHRAAAPTSSPATPAQEPRISAP